MAAAGRDKRTSRKEALRRARREGWTERVRSEADHRALEAGHWFDAAAAERVREFFRKFLRHSKGEWAGKPFELLPWQWEDVVAPLFGWKRPDGLRRFRKAYIEIPKKNGKSSLASGLALYLLVADGEPGAEIYCLAPETPVLCDDLFWRPVSDLRIADKIVGFDETPNSKGNFRKLRSSSVVSVGRAKQPCWRISLEDGRQIIASSQHRWFGRRWPRGQFKDWITTDKLQTGSWIRDLGKPWGHETTWEAGYLAGVFDGEAAFHKGKERSGFRIAFAQKPGRIMDRVREILRYYGFDISPIRQHPAGCETFEIRGLYDCLRFLGQMRPERLLASATHWWQGMTPNRTGSAVVQAIEYLGEREVVTIGTSTKTLFANGLFSHNSAAADRDQASIVFNEAALMVRASPGLKGRALVTDSRKQIGWPLSNSYYKALSADVPTKEGLNWHGLLFDELHAQRTRRLWDALMYGGIARRQPLLVAITTAGYDRESICYEQHEYARRVTEGQVRDLSFLPVLYAAGAKADWTKPKAWRKANPSMGVIFSEVSVARDCQEARESPRKENAFRQRRLNQWTEQAERWIVMEKWDACGLAEVDAETLAGRPCYAGLDLSSTTDLTALTLLFPPAEEEKGWSMLAFFWAPETGARAREDRDGVPYLTWAKEGLVELTPGEIVDYDRIRARIGALGERYEIREIALDRWNATQLSTQLDGDGFTVVPFGQGYASMSGPAKELEKRILAGELAHGGNPVMRWMAANAAVERDAADNIKPSKKKSTERIDGITALVMATGREMVQGAGEDRESVYEKRGVLVL